LFPFCRSKTELPSSSLKEEHLSMNSVNMEQEQNVRKTNLERHVKRSVIFYIIIILLIIKFDNNINFMYFIYIFIHPWNNSFIHFFILLLIYSIMHGVDNGDDAKHWCARCWWFIHSYIRSIIHLFHHSFSLSFIHSIIHSFIHSFIHAFIHSFIPQSFNHSH